MRISNLTVIILIPALAGLDVGRFHGSNLDTYFAAIGSLLIVVSSILLNWAMVVNPHLYAIQRGMERFNWVNGMLILTGMGYPFLLLVLSSQR